MNETADSINRCQWLFLRSLNEPEDNQLRLVVEEAKAGSLVDSKSIAEQMVLPQLESILRNARPIEHSIGCEVFEISWESYVAYSVRNESYVSRDKYEEFHGRWMVKYKKSRFLDYVALGTFATSDYPGPLVHWGVICGNHIIDVVSTEEPSIRSLHANA